MTFRAIMPHTLKAVFRFFKYPEERKRLFREIPIKKNQNKKIKSISADSKKLIVFFVPAADRHTGLESISGGVISLVSLCEETKKLSAVHHAETLMCVYPRGFLFGKHQNFPNNTDLFRFEQLPARFSGVNHLILHIPELLAPYFKGLLLKDELKWIRQIAHVHINVVNANIMLMPVPSKINELEEIAHEVTITAAHAKYCTQYHRNFYGKPLHKFSAWISPEQYTFVPFEEKENCIVVSPDFNTYRDEVLQKLRQIEGLKIVVLENLSYLEFKQVIAKAKWALTFGEGLDGYILEPVFSGAFGIAVFNEDFFTDDFKTLEGIYASYDHLCRSIVADIKRKDNPIDFKIAQKYQFELCAKYYNYSQYRENIKKFYLQEYTFK